ncbi:MAG: universal stress protein [Anaerolineae bacterium]|nr:universal stress protein [Anaerolineae bacterium]
MFDHILVPMDGSSLAECVLPHAMAVARACGAQVTLLRVLERPQAAGPTRSVDPLDWHIRKAEARVYLDGLSARLQETGLRTESTLLEGQAAERIIEFVRGHDVNLIVLSSHGRSGLSDWNVSSIVQKIILRAYAPVMIVRAYQPVAGDLTGLRYRHVLIPLDGSQRAECALPLATTLSRSHGSELLLVHVVSRPEMVCRAPPTQEDIELVNRLTERNRLEATRCLENLRSRLPLAVQTRVLVSDNTAATLHRLVKQENVDLVVLSAHGCSGRTEWPYGSLVVNFIAYGSTPLLIVQDLSPDEVERTQAEMVTREHKGH